MTLSVRILQDPYFYFIFQVYTQTLHSPPPSSTSASTIVSVHSSNVTSPAQSFGDVHSPRSPMSPMPPGSLPGGGSMTSQKIPAATPSSDSMSFPSPPSEASESNATTPCEEHPKSRRTPTTPVETFVTLNTGYLETNIDSPEYAANKHAAHLASQETLDSHSLDTQSLDARSLDAPSQDNFSESGTEIVLVDEEVQYVDIRSNRTSASDVDRPVELPIKSQETKKDTKSPNASPTDKDLLELNSILLSPAQTTTNTKEAKSDSPFLPHAGTSMTSHDQSPTQSGGAYSSPDQKEEPAKSPDTSFMSHNQTSGKHAQNYNNTQAVLTKDERSQDQMSGSRSNDIDIKTPTKHSGMKTPEMSSSPMDVDSLSSSYDKMVDSFSPGEKAVAMTPDGVSMEELSDLEPSKDRYSKVDQRSRTSKASTDSMASSGDELGQGKMDISFHSDKDVLEEEMVFMETNSKSKSSSIDSLDKGPGAPKSPKLEEENTVKAKINTANKELLKQPDKLKSPEVETKLEVKSRKSPSFSPNSTVSSTNGVISPVSNESVKSAIDDVADTSMEKPADSSFVMRSAGTKTKSAPVPKRKRSVKDLLSQFETLSQSPPKEGQGSSPPQGVEVTEPNEASKARPAVFQKPKIVHLKTLSPSAGQDASDFSQMPQQTFQTKAPTKTTPEAPKKSETVTTSTPVSKPKEKTTPPVNPRVTKERPIPSEKVMTNGQSVMSKSMDQSMLLKSLDSSNTSELSIDTSSSSDIMSRSMEIGPSEPNRDKPAKPAKKLGHSPSFKERLRMYESQKQNKSQEGNKPQQAGLTAGTDLSAPSHTDRASSEESVGSVRNLSKMFERQNSNRSDGFSDRSRSVSREPEEQITKQATSMESTKATKDAKVSSTKDEPQSNTQQDSQASKVTSPTKEKKSVKKLLGMFEQQNPTDQDGNSNSSSSDERGARGGKKPWTAIV